MKKFLSIILTLALFLSVLVLTSCTIPEEDVKLKLGLGVHISASATSANADKNGSGSATLTAAAVLVDDNGKIIKAFIDCADNTVAFTLDGKAVTNATFETKRELGNRYGMTEAGSAKEWFEQINAFTTLIEGKTLSQVKALAATNGKGTDEVINAGCTIAISEFIAAVEKAVNNAVVSDATAKDTIKLGISTVQETEDATAEKGGTNSLETYFFAAAVNTDGKVVAATSDCAAIDFTFTATGTSTFDSTNTIETKKELGTDYGMKGEGYGSAKEWFEHAAAFDAACIGKTASEITALMVDGYGNADLQAAGCTIAIDGFVKAASKIK